MYALCSLPNRVFFRMLTVLEPFHSNLTNVAGSREILAKMKIPDLFKTVEGRQQWSMEHEHKLGVTLSESVIEKYVRRPLAGISP